MRTLLTALLFLAACTNDGELDCPIDNGTFRATLIHTGGTCGAIAPTTTAGGGDWCDTLPPDCSGTRRCSRDMCAIRIDLTCAVPDGTIEETGMSTATDEDTIRGFIHLRVFDTAGAFVCESDYDTVATRL